MNQNHRVCQSVKMLQKTFLALQMETSETVWKEQARKLNAVIKDMTAIVKSDTDLTNAYMQLEKIMEENTSKQKFLLALKNWYAVFERTYLNNPDYLDFNPLDADERKLQNSIDITFYKLMDAIACAPRDRVLDTIKDNWNVLSKEIQNGISDYTDKYQFWGSIHAAENDYTLLENRADALKNHCNDFIWLYEKLEDYRSKTVLSAIVQNWLCFEFNFLDSVREKMFPDYFDLDVFPEMRDEVFVDVGAFNGDTVDQLFNLYGSTSFQKVYCYEITPQSCSEIRNKFSEYPNAVVKQKGLGSTYGKFYIEENHTTASANTLTGLENAGVGVETVPLDKDVNEPVTFIKMDIEGAEKDALLGAKQHIAKDKPKLGIAVYHNHEDLWKIPQMLLKMNTNYQFYLRYHGGNIFPTEITLLAL